MQRYTCVRGERNVLPLGRAAGSASRLHDGALSDVVFTIPQASKAVGLSSVSVGKATGHLADLGIVREVTGRRRNRTFVYWRYLEILQEGTGDGAE
jgi:Fic family protein